MNQKLHPQDLRLGNLMKGIYFTEGCDKDEDPKEVLCKFTGYDPSSDYIYVELLDKQSPEYEFQYFLPIQLTEDVLLKCGFKQMKIDRYTWLELCVLNMKFIFDNIKIKVGLIGVSQYEYVDDMNLFYLHQLQNLYYSLTGQELTINL